MIQKYAIKYEGRTMEIAGHNAANKAKRLSNNGATVKAKIITPPGDEPANLTVFDAESLAVLKDIAKSEGWDKLLHQIRQEEQKELQ